ncbi:alpha/beta hydrolase fold domain-containing protein [Streptomyces sp. BG9H]|uniref:Alpha/beta hydrolase fold domain-containing protein n=1 Tax=Streptomyces anatolicus TaxID=2675858 RepID=A0ABS6YJ65_9ACTN|nr:alpha/beta hydrolase [Streptomyces anatolicus]MBW5421431.1 alpha/beta hydrolase fold domain-containing protein [Streptomyces anatolicus]
MPLDPTVAGVRDYRVATGFTPLYTMSVDQARKADRETEAENWDWHEQPAEVFDLDIPGPTAPLTLRVYRPKSESEGPLPVLMYFFGGGWVVGSLDTSDAICRALAGKVPCVIVSVGYRLAPEHPFPAAIDDCYAAVKWVGENASQLGGDSARIGLAGDSSGGNLAAAMALMARDEKGPAIAAQVLVYPPMANDAVTKSMSDNKDPMFFNAHSSEWFWSRYLSEPADGDSPYASPLKAADHSGLPPTLMMTAEFCPLHDEGEAYADALSRAGVPVEYHRYADLPHGFLALSSILDTSRKAFDVIAEFLRERLG